MSFGKKKVTQQDLRRLMHEHKNKKSKKIISPVAKYNDIGQLTCTLCKNVIASESLWETHKKSKQHLDSIAQLKREIQPTSSHEWKRPADVSPQPPPKKLKGILKTVREQPDTRECSTSENNTSNRVNAEIPSHAPNANLNNKQHIENIETEKPTSLSQVLRKVSQNDNMLRPGISRDPNIPENFFDLPNGSSGTMDTRGNDEDLHSEEVRAGAQEELLPEGFFDDPLLDAKARNIEYKNPVEEEWEKFQKEIKEETTVSAQIIAEDQDDATAERQIDEIDEQMRNWSRVLNMEVKKEQIAQELGKKTKSNVEDSSSGEESDFEEYLNWRVKKAFD